MLWIEEKQFYQHLPRGSSLGVKWQPWSNSEGLGRTCY